MATLRERERCLAAWHNYAWCISTKKYSGYGSRAIIGAGLKQLHACLRMRNATIVGGAVKLLRNIGSNTGWIYNFRLNYLNTLVLL